jgi:hypothetical protein
MQKEAAITYQVLNGVFVGGLKKLTVIIPSSNSHIFTQAFRGFHKYPRKTIRTLRSIPLTISSTSSRLVISRHATGYELQA